MLSPTDRERLRVLASRVREVAELPEMGVRAQRWRNQNRLVSERPMVLCYPEGSWVELLPDAVLQCESALAREWEWTLLSKLYWWDRIKDDNLLEPVFDLPWRFDPGNYGLDIPHRQGEHRGSYTWDPPVKDFDRDFPRLRYREPSVDADRSEHEMEVAREVFGDVLPPRRSGSFFWTQGLTWKAVDFVGMEGLMMLMVDHPEHVHRLMSWLRDEHHHYLDYFEKNGYLTLNNRSQYVGSGGVGFTEELPTSVVETGAVRCSDLWGFAESQETVGISPAMFEEFVLPYQLPLLERFGLNCYGCCEPVHLRWDGVRQVPRLRRVSVSPWCDQEIMAGALGGDYIFSRKPNPALVASGFDEALIRRDLATTLAIAGEGVLEIILKDTHTVGGDPSRITRWVQIALELSFEHASGSRTAAPV